MLSVGKVQTILEAIFAMPVLEHDAQLVLDRINQEIYAAQQALPADGGDAQPGRDTGEGFGPRDTAFRKA